MAEDVLRIAWNCRDLMPLCVVVRHRSGPMSTKSVLMTQQEMLGTVWFVTNTDPGKFMNSSALGLDHTTETWWVASYGRWCSQRV